MRISTSAPTRIYHLRQPSHKRRTLALTFLLPLGFAACQNESFKPKVIGDDSKLFWALELNHHAVVLSKAVAFDTLRLVAVPRNYQGEHLDGLPAPRYVSTDPAKVAVTSDGMLAAVAATSDPVAILATLTSENLKYVDTVFVKVVTTDPPPVLASFSVHPLPPDSAKVATVGFASDGKPGTIPADTLRPRAADPNGVSFDNLIAGGVPVYFRSSDPTIAKINRTTGILHGLKPGAATIYAKTTVFGVTKEDALPYRIGYPISASVRVGHPGTGHASAAFLSPEWRVGVGAHVGWHFTGAEGAEFGNTTPVPLPEVDITFDEAALPNVGAPIPAIAKGLGFFNAFCPPLPGFFTWGLQVADCSNSGNIILTGGTFTPDLPPYPLFIAIRRFLAPGTYRYRSTIYGTSGVIIVVDEHE